MILGVSLTAEHIRIGNRDSLANSPICHAIRAAGGRDVLMIGTGFVELVIGTPERRLFELPSEATTWDLQFERGREVAPIDFVITEVVNG
ncbi:hypothetical protein EON81_17410 [bacterium]|nr:MAG: hypothetical protein EON81_17410 [bacterium]